MSAFAGCIQGALEHLYRIDGALDVRDFRVDRTVLHEILGAPAANFRETLVVQAVEDETFVALFLCDDIERSAQRFLHQPCPQGLDALCVAIEGVSHFVYFTFCGARQERSVSLVELELQAEIDKFLMLRAVFGLSGAELRSRLYDGFRWVQGLSPDARRRYRFANRHGRRYARWLDREFQHGRGSEALADARQLFRRPLEDKLSTIARSH